MRRTIARRLGIPFVMASTLSIAAFSYSQASQPTSDVGAGAEWRVYMGDQARTHYSRLDQITPKNVASLQVAWTYDTGEGGGDVHAVGHAAMEANPLVIDGRMYFTTPNGKLVCLDAATGKSFWTFDPGKGAPAGRSKNGNRGVAYWSSGDDKRVYFVFEGDIVAVDAMTGKPIPSFGVDGHLSLKIGIDRDPMTIFPRLRAPVNIYKDYLIFGGMGNAPGDIRAVDVRTGKLRWTFHTVPHPGEFGHETWPADAWKTAIGANNWAGMAIDEKRGMLFIPTAFPQNYYGVNRRGDNLFSNTIIALDAQTGKRLWHFQTIHHDLWDWDLPSPPTLVTIRHQGRKVDALVQITKQGYVYVLDRVTGKSIFPIIDQPTFPSEVPGEQVAPSQPVPSLPAPYVRQTLTEADLTRRTPEAAADIRKRFAGYSHRGMWDPPSEKGTIVSPGMEGGASWGGAAFDPASGLVYFNANENPWIIRLRKRRQANDSLSGKTLYRNNCSGCHGADQKGNESFPSLVNITARLSRASIEAKIAGGGGNMPPFGQVLNGQQIGALIGYLQSGEDTEGAKLSAEAIAAKGVEEAYELAEFGKFLDKDGYPAVAPPWGSLNALDLNSGKYVWKVPLGEYPELAAKGLKNTGSENYGGPLLTAGNLIFIGATAFDSKFRAFDKRSGKLLWETTLPASGNGTPSSYWLGGRQYVVITAAGGKDSRSKTGSRIVAFALPAQGGKR
jgi:quinoprotein glucose dehydrogenase